MAIDRITIKINLNVKTALSGLDKLEKKLEEVGETLGKKIGKGFQQIVDALNKLDRGMKNTTNNTIKFSQTLKQSMTVTNKQINSVTINMRKQNEQVKKNTRSLAGYGAAARWMGLQFMRAAHDIGRFANRMAADTGKVIGSVLDSAGQGLKGIGAGKLGGNILSPIIEGIRTGSNVIMEGLEKITKGVLSTVSKIAGGIAKIGASIVAGLATALGGLAGLITGRGLTGGLLGAILGSVLGSIPKAAADAFAGVADALSSVLGGLVGLVSGIFQAVVNTAAQILNGLISIVQGIVTKITSAFASLIGKVADIMGKVVGGVTAVFATMTTFAVKQVMDMDRRLATAFGLIPKAGKAAFLLLREGVADLARDIPYLAGRDIAQGLFQAISAGAREPSRALEIVKQSAIAGVAGGLENIDEVVRAVTRTSAIFKEEIKDTVDLLFQAQNLGQLTFGELARGIGLVAGIARTAKVDLTDLLGVLAAGSRVLDPESLFTGTRRLVQTLAAPSPEARKARKGLGIEFKVYTDEEKEALAALESDIAKKTKRLDNLLRRPFRGISARHEMSRIRTDLAQLGADFGNLEKASGKLKGVMAAIEEIEKRGLSFEQIRAIVPEIRAAAVALGISSLGRGTRDEIKRLMADFKNAAQNAFDIAEKQLPAKLSRAWGGFRELVRQTLDAITPALSGALDSIINRMKEIEETPAFAHFKEDVADFVGAAITKVGELFAYMVNNWDSISAKIEKAWSAFKTGVVAAFKASKELLEIIRDAVDPDRPSEFRDAWEAIVKTLTTARKIIIDIAHGDFSSLHDAADALWDNFSTRAQAAWEHFLEWGLGAVATISDALAGMLTGLEDAVFKATKASGLRLTRGEEGITSLDKKTLPPSARNLPRGDSETLDSFLRPFRGLVDSVAEDANAEAIKAAREVLSGQKAPPGPQGPAGLTGATGQAGVAGAPGVPGPEILREPTPVIIKSSDGAGEEASAAAAKASEKLLVSLKSFAGLLLTAEPQPVTVSPAPVKGDMEPPAALPQPATAQTGFGFGVGATRDDASDAAIAIETLKDLAPDILEQLRLDEIKRLARLPLAPIDAAKEGNKGLFPTGGGLLGRFDTEAKRDERLAHDIADMRLSLRAVEGATGALRRGAGAARETGKGFGKRADARLAALDERNAERAKAAAEANEAAAKAAKEATVKAEEAQRKAAAEKVISISSGTGKPFELTDKFQDIPLEPLAQARLLTKEEQKKTDAFKEEVATWGKLFDDALVKRLRKGNIAAGDVKGLRDIPPEVFGKLFPKGLFGDAPPVDPRSSMSFFGGGVAGQQGKDVGRLGANKAALDRFAADKKVAENTLLLAEAERKFAAELLALRLGPVNRELDKLAAGLGAVPTPAEPQISSTGRRRGFAEKEGRRRLPFIEPKKGRGAGIRADDGGFAAAFGQTFGGAIRAEKGEAARKKAQAGLSKEELRNARDLESQLREKGAPVDAEAIRAAVMAATERAKEETVRFGARPEELDIGKGVPGKPAAPEEGAKDAGATLADVVKEGAEKAKEAGERQNATLKDVAEAWLKNIKNAEEIDRDQIESLKTLVEIITANAAEQKAIRDEQENIKRLLASLGATVD